MIARELRIRKSNSTAPFDHTVGWPLYDENELCAALDSLLDLSLSHGPRGEPLKKLIGNILICLRVAVRLLLTPVLQQILSVSQRSGRWALKFGR